MEDARIDPSLPVEPNGERVFSRFVELGLWGRMQAYLESDAAQPHLAAVLCRFASAKDTVPEALLSLVLERIEPAALWEDAQSSSQPLNDAIRARNWSLVEQLLERMPVISADTPLSDNPLAVAIAQNASAAVLDQVVARDLGALTRPDAFGWSVFHRACADQDTKGIQYLKQCSGGDPKPWFVIDGMGREPIALLRMALRANVLGTQRAKAWPKARRWDSGVRWKLVTGPRRDAMIERLKSPNNSLDVTWAPLDVGEHAVIEAGHLSFYARDVAILRVSDPSWSSPTRRAYLLERGRLLRRLSSVSAPIHDVNADVSDTGKVSLRLTEKNIADYLRFFCFFTHGDEGMFLILEDAHQWPLRSAIAADARALLEDNARPTWTMPERDGTFGLTASVLYGGGIFSVDFALRGDGTIKMVNDRQRALVVSRKPDGPARSLIDSVIY